MLSSQMRVALLMTEGIIFLKIEIEIETRRASERDEREREVRLKLGEELKRRGGGFI